MRKRAWLAAWVLPALGCGDVVGEPIRMGDEAAAHGDAGPEGQSLCDEECRASERCVDGVCVELDRLDNVEGRCESGCIRDGECVPADRCLEPTGDRH